MIIAPPARLSTLTIRLWLTPLLALLILLLAACNTLPTRPNAPVSYSVAADKLRSVDPRQQRYDMLYPLIDPLEAFSTRVQLVRRAQHSIDLAYYIWDNDTTGRLMLGELFNAAQRGVRVRLLLDDQNTVGLDALWRAVAKQPNIEVRLFNPFSYREQRLFNHLIDFSRTQRRLHGKALIVDGQVMIVGGRNMADAYYRLSPGYFFADLDVMVAGSALASIGQGFDQFWNHPLAYPVIGLLTPQPAAEQLSLQQIVSAQTSPDAKIYRDAIASQHPLDHWLNGVTVDPTLLDSQTVLTSTKFVTDSPDKITQSIRFEQTMAAQILQHVRPPQRSLDIISPYLVPSDIGTAALVELAKAGVRVRILTNSLATTDVAALHDFYARRRRELLTAGVELYEFKPDAHADPIRKWRLRETQQTTRSGLHAKAISWDHQMTYVGSMNLDPRSVLINAEWGVIVASTGAADLVDQVFSGNILRTAYQLKLDPQGELIWLEKPQNGTLIEHHREPANRSRRALSWLVGWLPIERWM